MVPDKKFVKADLNTPAGLTETAARVFGAVTGQNHLDEDQMAVIATRAAEITARDQEPASD